VAHGTALPLQVQWISKLSPEKQKVLGQLVRAHRAVNVAKSTARTENAAPAHLSSEIDAGADWRVGHMVSSSTSKIGARAEKREREL